MGGRQSGSISFVSLRTSYGFNNSLSPERYGDDSSATSVDRADSAKLLKVDTMSGQVSGYDGGFVAYLSKGLFIQVIASICFRPGLVSLAMSVSLRAWYNWEGRNAYSLSIVQSLMLYYSLIADALFVTSASLGSGDRPGTGPTEVELLGMGDIYYVRGGSRL